MYLWKTKRFMHDTASGSTHSAAMTHHFVVRKSELCQLSARPSKLADNSSNFEVYRVWKFKPNPRRAGPHRSLTICRRAGARAFQAPDDETSRIEVIHDGFVDWCRLAADQRGNQFSGYETTAQSSGSVGCRKV